MTATSEMLFDEIQKLRSKINETKKVGGDASTDEMKLNALVERWENGNQLINEGASKILKG